MNMKLKKIILWTVLALSGTALLLAHDEHDEKKEHHHTTHDKHASDKHEFKKGPNGGQLVDNIQPAFEVAVDKERKVRILFVDGENKPLPLGERGATGMAGDRAKPEHLTFAKGKGKDENILISDKALPKGDHVALILRITQKPDEKPQIARLTLHLH